LFADIWIAGQLRGGVSVAWGSGFADVRRVARPYLSVEAGARRLIAGPFLVFVGLEVPLTRLELEALPSQDRVQAPRVRIELGIGLSSDR
jgi:hypothetical protein